MLFVATAPSVGAAQAPRLEAESRRQLDEALKVAVARPPSTLIPRADFLQGPVISDVQLAADGRHVSFVRRRAGQYELWLRELRNGKEQRLLANSEGTDARWSGDGARLWLGDATGLAVYETAEGRARRIIKWQLLRQQKLWAVEKNAPEFAIVSEKIEQGGQWRYRYLSIDRQGRSRLLQDRKLPLRGALLDSTGGLKFSVGYEGSNYDSVVRHHAAGNSGQEILRCPGIERCLLIGNAGERLWMLSHRGEPRLSVQEWAGGRWRTVQRDADNIADAGHVLWAGESQGWLAAAYHSDRLHWYGRDARVQRRLDALKAHLPTHNVELTSSADGRLWLVRARQAVEASDRYFIYTPAADRLQPLLASSQTSLGRASGQLARALPVRYRGRDGTRLHGYVYLPRGIAGKRMPLMAMLHGGPFKREYDEYNAAIQLLANRGNAVFVPNFRGSTGYGVDYVRSIQGGFGKGRVLNDIVDGLDALLGAGVGDPARQAVFGQSFGGYGSLLAVAHYPKRFAFAVASAAPVDFGWLARWTGNHDSTGFAADGPPAKVYFSHHNVPTSDPAWSERMRRESPLANIGSLRTPLYIWAGAHDDRVPLPSVVRYVAAGRARHNSIELLIDPDSGHSPTQLLNQEALVYLIESAASRYFGGPVSPPSPALREFIQRNLRKG